MLRLMLPLLIISWITLVFVCKFTSFTRINPWAAAMRSVSLSISGLVNRSLSGCSCGFSPMKRENPSHKVVDGDEETEQMSVLDLPELVLECILEKLPSDGLCRMAAVCSSLRDRCMSDHLWEKHMNQKWGRVIGPAAFREWQCQIASGSDSSSLEQGNQRAPVKYLLRLWPVSWVWSRVSSKIMRQSMIPVDSVMAWFVALESGRFWFPAHVYNRENGHVGFMLSCYDAELQYDSRTDMFQARYPPHGKRAIAIEKNITWERIRAAPVDTPPHDLHASDCLNELHPGDHIEIQWRRNKEFPYGWWYGVVGHLESCDGNETYCRCRNSDLVTLEFNQYTPGSRWRRSTISRRDHREEGNEADGFYGGIRKLKKTEEIATWKQLWPKDVLQ